jgi:hypothetical protein
LFDLVFWHLIFLLLSYLILLICGLLLFYIDHYVYVLICLIIEGRKFKELKVVHVGGGLVETLFIIL